MTLTYDAIVIGAGQAGTPLSKKLAKAGWKTLLIEKRLVGGTCVNDGCTPTKAMIASARMAYLAANSQKLGIAINDYSVDIQAIIKRKNDIVQSFRGGAEKGIASTENLELIYGEGRFLTAKEIEITLTDGTIKRVTGTKIFINTGTATAIPPIEGIDDVPYLTSTTILDLQVIPTHLLIIGSGYIGLEFAQMYRRFGSKVTILESSATFMRKEDRDIAECVAAIFKEENIVIKTEAKAGKVAQNGNEITVTVEVNGNEEVLLCSHLLIASGRKPQTEKLDVKQAGIAINDKGFVVVNDHLETNVPGIYALGDVKGGPAFTHISYNDHVVIIKNLLENDRLSIKDRPVPYCMFTDPQLGRIGLTEKEARDKGLHIKVAILPMENVARAIETTETRGMMKAIVDAETKKILGVAILGEEGGEVMTVLQMAMAAGFTYEQIRYTIFAHPLYSESLNNLFAKLEEG